jgi:ATP-dependent DNA helicase RecG
MPTLSTPISDAGAIFKRYASKLERLKIYKLEDFLYHLPFRYDNFSIVSDIGNVQPGEVVTIKGTLLEIKNNFLGKGRVFQKARIADETGEIEATWFNQPFLTKYLHRGDKVALAGKIEQFGRKLSMTVPEYEILNSSEHTLHTGRLVPVYPETQGISSKWIRRQTYKLLRENKNEIKEFVPEEILQRNTYMDLYAALKEIHFPYSLELAERARERLAFNELFLLQLSGFERKKEWREKASGSKFEVTKFEKDLTKFIASLPFTLTSAQERALDDIKKDIASSKPMNRLLQGDVGSGKTIVAATIMYLAHLNGFQSVLMAPTEILAQQHFATISQLLNPLGIKTSLATSSTKTTKTNKDPNSSFIIPNSQNFDILIGTHAVLSEKVTFHNLGLVVIDEQQRFGVEQRGIIRGKGNNPHLLTMTATPIPRTIALTMYGDLDLSYLNEMPKGRKTIKTWLVSQSKRQGAYDWIRREIKENKSQAFIICPFIEESETMTTIKAATKEFEVLRKKVFPDLRLGLLHGKQKPKEKDAVLKDFRQKKFDILVATPVVEVGIDIPNATVIVIEASERFGLAGLHQLRGRVGRGDKQSYCLLFTESTSETTHKRLKAMEVTQIGSELAELDFKLRGPGELFGTRQSGLRELKIASFSDTELIEKARKNAEIIFDDLKKYPTLKEMVQISSSKTISPD